METKLQQLPVDERIKLVEDLWINASAASNDWTAMGPSGGAVNKIVYSQNGNTAYMAAAGGYYRSQDSGVSWQLVKSDFFNAPVDVSIDPSDPTRVYVVAQNAPCFTGRQRLR